MINITEINKALVLQALYNASKVQGLGFLQATGKGMTIQEAEDVIKLNPRLEFDYLFGKVMKVNLSTNVLNPYLYDRDNGPDGALRALQNAGLKVTKCKA